MKEGERYITVVAEEHLNLCGFAEERGEDSDGYS